MDDDMPLRVGQTVDAGPLEEAGGLLAERFLLLRQFREIDGNWSDLATGHREVGGILVEPEGAGPIRPYAPAR